LVAGDARPGEVTDVDVLIVGAGPAGLFAAYYAGFRGLTTAVMDSLPELGGQVSAMYPERLIFDVGGFPAVRGRDLVDALVRQAAAVQPRYLLAQQASELAHSEEAVLVTSSEGTSVRARAVIITGGLGTFTPRPLPAGSEYLGCGLAYFVPKLDDYAGLDVLVAGGGDSALDWALSLEPLARSVTLVHRREGFRAHERTIERVLASSVQVLLDSQVSAVSGAGQVEAVEIVHAPTGEPRRLDVQRIVAALGFTADLGPLTRWGLDVKRRRIVVDSTMGTGVPRIFAAGDIADYPGKVRLIATGFGEAATAVNNAAPVIHPGAHVFPGHSSDGG
jgi:thioredoxin reductase (NADPH)